VTEMEKPPPAATRAGAEKSSDLPVALVKTVGRV